MKFKIGDKIIIKETNQHSEIVRIGTYDNTTLYCVITSSYKDDEGNIEYRTKFKTENEISHIRGYNLDLL